MACIVLGEEYDSYVDELGWWNKTNTLKDLQQDLWACKAPSTPTPWHSNPLMARLLPFLSPASLLGTLLVQSSCLQFLNNREVALQNPLSVRFWFNMEPPPTWTLTVTILPLYKTKGRSCGTLVAQGYRGRVKGASTSDASDLRTAGVGSLQPPNLIP